MNETLVFPIKDITTGGVFTVENEKIKAKVIDVITGKLGKLEKIVVERLLGSARIFEHIEEYVARFKDVGEGKEFNAIGQSQFFTLTPETDINNRFQSRKNNIEGVLQDNKTLSPIITAVRTFIGQNSLDKMLNNEGGSCLEAAISAAFIMALKTGAEAQDYQHPEIIGWNSRKEGGFLRKAYRSLLHDHYAVTFVNGKGEQMIVTHDGQVSVPLNEIKEYMSAGKEDQEEIIRRIFGLARDETIEDDHIKDMKRLVRITEAITTEE